MRQCLQCVKHEIEGISWGAPSQIEGSWVHVLTLHVTLLSASSHSSVNWRKRAPTSAELLRELRKLIHMRS